MQLDPQAEAARNDSDGRIAGTFEGPLLGPQTRSSKRMKNSSSAVTPCLLESVCSSRAAVTYQSAGSGMLVVLQIVDHAS